MIVGGFRPEPAQRYSPGVRERSGKRMITEGWLQTAPPLDSFEFARDHLASDGLDWVDGRDRATLEYREPTRGHRE